MRIKKMKNKIFLDHSNGYVIKKKYIVASLSSSGIVTNPFKKKYIIAGRACAVPRVDNQADDEQES